MRQKTYILIGSLMLAGVIAYPAMAGITLRASRPPEAQPIQIVSYLSDINEPLKKALLVHNLMNEMPLLRDAAKTADSIKIQGELMADMQKKLTACNVKKLGKVFKNPQKVWHQMNAAYEKQRQQADQKAASQKTDALTMSFEQRQKKETMGWSISRDILMDVYAHPEKWGEVNKGEAFPLWQDQIALFEQQWDAYYETLNAAYGVPLKGRPSVDEETRHNAEKYNQGLAAHKAYVANISKGKRSMSSDIVKQNPPQAPKGLPKWQDIVRVDPVTGQVTPEMPEPWRQMSDNKFKNYAAGGEMSQFFDGKTLTPKADAKVYAKSDLESEYDMTLAVDALEKGAAGSLGTHQKMVSPFLEKLAKLGVDTKNFDIANKGQYLRVYNQLKDIKKASMDDARKYIERLEDQDRTSPELIARREKLNAERRARLSVEAQAATVGMNDISQISQMSPSAQQRLLLAALEKDANASVHLTQTNAMNVDQLMRERKSTDKIIAESYQQINTMMQKQKEMIPQITDCHF